MENKSWCYVMSNDSIVCGVYLVFWMIIEFINAFIEMKKAMKGQQIKLKSIKSDIVQR